MGFTYCYTCSGMSEEILANAGQPKPELHITSEERQVMSTENTNTVAANPSESRAEDLASRWQRVVRRRFFLSGLGLAGASVAASSGDLSAEDKIKQLTRGDAALLQFELLAESIETDLWQQSNELRGAVDHNDNTKPVIT